MFKRLKRLLVTSYVGAIALGILLAEAIRAFTDIFTVPAFTWATYRTVLPNSIVNRGSPLEQSLPYVGQFILLILVDYLLLLWLYAEPIDSMTTSASISGPATTTEKS